MSKKISLITIISLAIVLSSTFIFAQGPKPIFQQVFDTDNESHPTGEITFNVWIATRPDYVLNERSTGSLVSMDATNTRFLVSFNAGNFPGLGAPVDWTAGEIIHLEVYREATEHVAIVEFPISAGGSGQFRYRREDSDESIYLREYPNILFDSNLIADYRVGTNAAFVEGFNPDENGLYRAIDWMNEGRSWQIEFSTEGMEELFLTSKLRRQFVGGTPANRRYGPKHFTTLYSIDGEEWIPVGNPNEDDGFFWWELPDTDEWMNMAFALPEACENQRQVWVRWLHLEDWFDIVNNAFGEIKDVKVTGYGEGEPEPEYPDIAKNPVPKDGALGVKTDLEQISWDYEVDPDYANPVGFRVYGGLTEEFNPAEYVWVPYVGGQTTFTINNPLGRLEYLTKYYWKVVPTTIDGAGRSTSRTRRNAVDVRETYTQSYRGDAEDVPTWSLTTRSEDTNDGDVPRPVNPNNIYVGQDFRFVPAADEDDFIDIYYVVSDDPNDPFIGEVQGFSNPDALGRFYRFVVSDGAVFRLGFVRLLLDARPNQIWFLFGGNWVQVPFEWVEEVFQDPPITYALINLALLPAGRNDVFSFACDDGVGTLPVELSSFTVNVTAQNFVQLQWVSETETNMLGYNVYRANGNILNDAEMITQSIIPATNTSEKQTYTFQDIEVLPGRTYFYWLQTIDLDLTNSFHGPISITLEEEEEVVPPVYVTGLEQNYPNPFNPSTLIKFSVKEDTDVTLTIYNVLGQVVKTLADGHREAGNYQVEWTGTDNYGKTVTSGIYFYRLTTDHYNKVYKMMLVK